MIRFLVHSWYKFLIYLTRLKLNDLEVELSLQFISLEEYLEYQKKLFTKLNHYKTKIK